MQRELPRQRSYLAVPATSERFLAKATQSAADAVFIDLEDAVVAEAKVEARARALAAIDGLDWGKRLVCVRVNGLDTPWGREDVREMARSRRLDRILLAKCESVNHVHVAANILRAAEGDALPERPMMLEALIESPRAVVNVEAIAGASDMLAALVFGAGDYQVDLGTLGAPPPHWDYALARIANAARAFGLAPIDAPFIQIADVDGLQRAARLAASLGYEGKMCIHPSQLEAVNAAFSPDAAQVEWARAALEAMAAGAREGRGAVRGPKGEMLDLMHEKMARRILARAG
jgi:malyl-CoA/(S)-citramalyl-CoA lyase